MATAIHRKRGPNGVQPHRYPQIMRSGKAITVARRVLQRGNQATNVGNTDCVEIHFDGALAHVRAAKNLSAAEQHVDRQFTLKRKAFHV